MSIMLVRVVPEGIIFGADRNITESRTHLSSGQTIIQINGQSQRPKVLRWPNRKALVGYVGVATIGGLPTDEWLYDFIGENLNFSGFKELANKLKDAVEEQRKLDEGSNDPEALVIHLGGFEERLSQMVPVVWYIRNPYGLSNGFYNDVRKEFLCTEEFWKYFDISPDLIRSTLAEKYASKNTPFGFHQGFDLGTFNVFDAFLNGAFDLLYKLYPDISAPQTLAEWEQHVKMSILTYGAYFEAYKRIGEQFVGGGVDVVSIKWPEPSP